MPTPVSSPTHSLSSCSNKALLSLCRLVPTTSWPDRTSAFATGSPIKPVAPNTRTFMMVVEAS